MKIMDKVRVIVIAMVIAMVTTTATGIVTSLKNGKLKRMLHVQVIIIMRIDTCVL